MSYKLIILIFALMILTGEAGQKVGLLNSVKDGYGSYIELAKKGFKQLPDSFTNGALNVAGSAAVGGLVWLTKSAYCYYYPDSCGTKAPKMDPTTLNASILENCSQLVIHNKYKDVDECYKHLRAKAVPKNEL